MEYIMSLIILGIFIVFARKGYKAHKKLLEKTRSKHGKT